MNTQELSLMDLLDLFPDDATARIWLHNQRWENGEPTYCLLCETKCTLYTFSARPGIFRCSTCQGEFSVRTGTLMECSHIPLRKWVIALWLFVTSTQGITSVYLAKALGITQKTAWFMLHRLRENCFTEHYNQPGVFEADEKYIGGLEKNKHSNKKATFGAWHCRKNTYRRTLQSPY